jgi:hypothetical protein
VVKASPDERGASELALHADPRQTRRYSRQAASERATAALRAAFPVALATGGNFQDGLRRGTSKKTAPRAAKKSRRDPAIGPRKMG